MRPTFYTGAKDTMAANGIKAGSKAARIRGCKAAHSQHMNMARSYRHNGHEAAALVEERRASEWADKLAELQGHPEDLCEKCKRPNIVWFAPSTLWNTYASDKYGILCPVCFVRLAENAGYKVVWELKPETIELEVGDEP